MLAIIASVGSFIPGLFGKKISFGLAKALGIAICVLGLILFLITAKALYDRSVVNAHEAEREAQASEAREEAADQRATDTIVNTRREEELHNAIDAAPKGGTLSPAARSLACERLRRQGRIPPACRPASGDGSEARPQ